MDILQKFTFYVTGHGHNTVLGELYILFHRVNFTFCATGHDHHTEPDESKNFMQPEGRAHSCLFVRLSICLSVHPSHFCPEHISKSIEGNSMKLDTPKEGHEENCRMQEP